MRVSSFQNNVNPAAKTAVCSEPASLSFAPSISLLRRRYSAREAARHRKAAAIRACQTAVRQASAAAQKGALHALKLQHTSG
jgi:hypothetical protein